MKSHGEEAFALLLRTWKLPPAEREYRFAPPRRWRFDFAWPDKRLAVEIEGGLWGTFRKSECKLCGSDRRSDCKRCGGNRDGKRWRPGRHNSPLGYQADLEKYNNAVMLGWRVLRYSTEDVLERPREIRQALEVMLDLAEAL